VSVVSYTCFWRDDIKLLPDQTTRKLLGYSQTGQRASDLDFGMYTHIHKVSIDSNMHISYSVIWLPKHGSWWTATRLLKWKISTSTADILWRDYICVLSWSIFWIQHASLLKILTTCDITQCGYFFWLLICDILTSEISIIFFPYRTSGKKNLRN